MSDMKTAIMDAAERHIQAGGFGGFSFREIAAEVGIKSASVHYHFPTKEDLTVAVIKRWIDYTMNAVDEAFAQTSDPVEVWTKALRTTVYQPPHMCPCTVLGASSRDLPEAVAAEVKRFFALCIDKMVAQGLTKAAAEELFSTLIGAMVVANALRDNGVYDSATQSLLNGKAA